MIWPWVRFLAVLEHWRRGGLVWDPDATVAWSWLFGCGCVFGWHDRAREMPSPWCCPTHGWQQRLAGLDLDLTASPNRG